MIAPRRISPDQVALREAEARIYNSHELTPYAEVLLSQDGADLEDWIAHLEFISTAPAGLIILRAQELTEEG